MSTFMPSDQERQLLEPILTRAATDAAYRERLLHDPRGAIEEETGVAPPSTFTVQFIEKPEGIDEVVVLPDYVDESAELTEAELEAVAGGAICWWTQVCDKTIGSSEETQTG